MNKIKVCIIGLSYAEKVFIKCLNNISSIQIIGIAYNKRNINSLKKKYKNIKFSKNFRNLIDNLKPQLVLIATPTYVQEEAIKFLVQKKIPFLCEKPLTINLTQAKNIFNLVYNSNIPSVIDYNFIPIPIFKFIKLYLNNNNDYLSYDLTWNFRSYPKQNHLKSWKFQNKLGGGTLNNYGSHLFSIIDYLFGDINKLRSYRVSTKSLNDKIIVTNFHNNKKNGQFVLSPALDHLRKFELNIYYKKYYLHLINNTTHYHSGFRLYKVDDKNNKKLLKKYYNYTSSDPRVTQTTKIIQTLIKKIKLQKKSYFDISLALRIQILIHFANKSISLKKKLNIKNS